MCCSVPSIYPQFNYVYCQLSNLSELYKCALYKSKQLSDQIILRKKHSSSSHSSIDQSELLLIDKLSRVHKSRVHVNPFPRIHTF